MSFASTYTKKFFLPNRNFSISDISTEITSKKKFMISNENFFTEFSSKKDIDLTRNVVWICPKCGHTYVGAIPANNCPICNSDYEINEL